MNRDEYQELVENAYSSKALSVEAFDSDDELDVLTLLGQWSANLRSMGKQTLNPRPNQTNEAGLKVRLQNPSTPASMPGK